MTNLKHIDLSNCKLPMLQLVSVSEMSDHSSPQHINLSQNYLDVEHYFNDATLPKLSNKELIHLDFSYYCKLSFAAVDHIFMLLKHCTSLTHLNLHSCSIAESTELLAFLQYNHNL